MTPLGEQPTSDGEAAGASGSKRKRVVLSIHEKQQVLQRLELGEPPATISRAFGISRQQVSDIKKNRARILAFCVDAKHLSTLQRKTLRATSEYHPGVEQELYRWIIRQRHLQRSVSPDALASKTAELFMQYAGKADSHGGSVSMKALAAWMRHFKRAHNIKALSDDEIDQLPETFTPAMDMAPVTPPGGAGIQNPALYASNPATTFSGVLNVDDMGSYISSLSTTTAATANVQRISHAASTADGVARSAAAVAAVVDGADEPGFLGIVEAVNNLNTQVAEFERTMNLKLDYLDGRLEKMCFGVLPAPFT